ncbi:MAG: hypothetical protein K2L38_00130, partial [Dysosmobacter sp.]|nr:hypothetical protein [Dysosmobacter sp.]
EYMDVFIYKVFPQGKPSGGKRIKRKPYTEVQKRLNLRHREEKLRRLLHNNFTPEDLEIHLTYRGEQPESDEEAARNLRNYIRRIQRLRKKLGLPPLKYIAVTERGKRGGRYHHHITVNGGIDRDTLESMWEYGRANSRRLQFDEKGLAGLGHYIVKSPIGGKAWTASKNLVDPEPRKRDGRISERKVRELAKSLESGKKFAKFECLYPGWLLSEAEAFHNDVNGGYYIAARFYKKNTNFIRPKLKRRN